MCCSQIKNYVIFQSSEVMKQSNAPCVSCQDTRINLRYLSAKQNYFFHYNEYYIIGHWHHYLPTALWLQKKAKVGGRGVCRIDFWSNLLTCFKRCGRTATNKLISPVISNMIDFDEYLINSCIQCIVYVRSYYY